MIGAFSNADVFVNTYYVRFNHGAWTFERAVQVTRHLISLAQKAGVRKIVHVSVSNASEHSDIPSYRNKGRIERLVRESGLDFTILQPAIVVGPGDILRQQHRILPAQTAVLPHVRPRDLPSAADDYRCVCGDGG